MAINFPNSPSVNDTHSFGGKTWKWDGTSWKLNSSPATGIGYTDLSVSQVAASGTGTLTYNNGGLFQYTPPDLSGFLTSIPIAAAGTLGGVKIGSNVSVTGDGTISVATPYTLPTAGVGSGGLLGGVKVDGTTITINAGVITSVASAASQITVADETTDTSCYVVFVNDTPGGQAAKTGSLLYNAASGQLQAGSFKKASGTSSEFLKADGSIDSNTYLTSQVKSDWNATTGAAEILNKPTIPAAQVQSDWGQTTTSAVDFIKNKPTIPSNIGDLTNVSSTAPNNNEVLKWNGSAWAPAADATGGGGGGISLTDLSVTTNSVGTAALSYNNSTGVFSYTPPDLSGYSTTSHNHSFISITGTPSSYDNGKWLRSTANGVEWVAAPSSGISGVTIQEEGTSLSTAATTINFTGAKVTASGTGATKTVEVATPTLAEVTTAGNSTTNNITVNDLNVDGNLTVSGTTTTIDTATLNIADNILTLNSNYSGSSPTANAGIEVERGTAANVALRWNETSDKWQFTNDGSNYSDIGSGSGSGTTNLGVTANGTSLTVTSDTGSDASIPAATSSAWGAMTDEMYDKLDGIATSANNYTHPNHSGDVTSTGDGATTIANNAVTMAKIENIATSRIMGRVTSGTGDPETLTASQVRTLLNVADGAEVNVQSDWNQTTNTADDFIKNKPTGLLTSVPTLTQVTGAGNSTTNAIQVGNCTVTGNLLVDGLVGISDTKITLNSDHSGSAPTADCDLVVERGNSADVRIRWDESEDKWTATNDGSNYFNLSGFSGDYNDLTNKPADTNNYASSLSWNSGNGVLTVNRSGLSALTVDLDGRYATGTIPTNNNQLTNGAGYITSSGSISGTAATAENTRIRTDTGNSYHNLVFVDTVTDNAFQTLKIDNEASALAYNPNQNILIAQTLASYRFLDWGNSYGTSGQVLTSQGSSQWSWTNAGFLGKTKITILTTVGTGNHTTESWCKTCWAIIQGGGGGAGNAWGSTGRGGNGGHGGMQINYQNDLTGATSIPYSVGAGGSRHYSGNCDDNLSTGQTGGSSYFGPTNNRGTAAGGGGGAGAYDGQIGANGADGGMRFFASDYGAGGIGGVNTGGDGCNTTSTDGTAGAIFILELG